MPEKERFYAMPGPNKPPLFIQFILHSKKMTPIDFFYFTDYLDWDKQGDDYAVLEPLIALLAKYGDDLIFAFDEMMAELLYRLDTRKIAQSVYKGENFSADEFLYARCVALINAKPYYNAVVAGRKKLKSDLGFEAILTVPELAWARCHKLHPYDYPHTTKYSYETMSNEEGWKEITIQDVDSYLQSLTKEPLDMQAITCTCGNEEFRIKLNQQTNTVQLICASCGKEININNQSTQPSKLKIKKCSNCKNDVFQVRKATYTMEDGQTKVYIGGLCKKCENIQLLIEYVLKKG